MVTATTATAVDNGEAQSEPIELSQIKNHDTKVYFNIQEKAPF